MRPLSVLCTLSVLLLFASTIDARKDLEEYWRTVMKGQPMPESIQDLLDVDPATSFTYKNADQKSNPLTLSDNVQPSEVESFAKNFNPRPNFLFYDKYNSHNDQPSEVKSFSKNFNSRPNFLFYDKYNSHNDQPSEVKSFDKDVLKADNKLDANA